MEEIYNLFIAHYYKHQYNEKSQNRKELQSQISALYQHSEKLRDMLFKNQIDQSDYKGMMAKNDQKIEALEEALVEIGSVRENVPKLIKQLVYTAMRVTDNFANHSIEFQRKLINVIYPQKVMPKNGKFRTALMNRGAALIGLVNKELAKNKNGKELDFSSLSHEVIPLGFEPRTTTLKV